MLVGRGSERSQVDSVLQAARSGRSGVLVLVGEPGIGKTALLDYASERAEGFRVLRALGVEVESDLPFSTLHELMRPVLDRIRDLPEPQASAIRTAFALGSRSEIDRFAVYVAVLGLLAEAAEREPLLVLVDDAQWLDASSADVIRFVARRLAAERIAVLVAARDGDASTFDAPELPTLRLAPLHREAAEALLDRRSPDLPPDLRERVIETSAGNPLALIELPGATVDATTEPLAVGRRIEQSFAARASDLPPDCRRALVVVAAASSSDVGTIGAALEELGLTLSDVEDAERTGLVVLQSGELVFTHPLVRSAVYHAADPAERRRANAALARAAHSSGDHERSAWYLASAATEPDEEVAHALEEAAQIALQRTGQAAASAAFARAAQLTPDREQRARRLLGAASAAWGVGLDRVEQLCREALTLTEDHELRGELHAELETALYWRGDLRAAHRIKTMTADELEADAPVQAAHMRARSTASLRHFLRGSESLEVAKVAYETLERAGGEDPRVPVMYAQALARAGSMDEAHALSERWAAATEAATDVTLRNNLAEIWMLEDRLHEAARVFAEWEAPARAAGDVSTLTNALEQVARADVLLGRFPAAYAAASESLELTALTPSEVLQVAESTVRAAEAAAWLGREDDAQDLAVAALELARRCDSKYLEAQVRAALGVLALSRGDGDEASRELEVVRDLVRGGGYRHPAFVQFSPELVEAYVRVGKRDEAEAEHAHLAADAAGARSAWALAAAARCRALADDDLTAFDDALNHHAASPRPVERARTELLYGDALRRAGRRVEARGHLRSALATFERAGAALWSERARDALEASGERLRRPDAPRDELTPQEFQVARIVASGASNKDTAARLFLSTKTIEFHLRNAYRKLGVTSRTQLAHALRETSGEESGRAG